jgi:hypothetical protein
VLYCVTTSAYSDAVKALRGALAADHKLAHDRAELARQKMMAARDNLNIHLGTHHFFE